MSIKRWFIKLIIFVVIAGSVLFGTFYILFMPYARDAACMYGLRLEPDNSLDVVLIGASSIYTSFYSPLAYEKEGFTSYAYSVSGMTAAVYKAALQEALAHHDPDLIVVDMRGFDYKEQYTRIALHKFLDVIPITSAARKEAIETIVPEEEKPTFINPWLLYHGEETPYKDCLRVLVDKITVRLNGCSITKNFASQCKIIQKSGIADYSITEEALVIADNFLAYCKEAGLENVLFIRNPVPYTYDSQPSYYEMVDKIEAAGYDFLDLYELQDEIGIDPDHDWADDVHLNIFGCEKYTCFFSKYIVDHYDINTEHTDEVTKEWEYCMSYNDHVINYLKEKCEENEGEYHYMQKLLVGSWTYK